MQVPHQTRYFVVVRAVDANLVDACAGATCALVMSSSKVCGLHTHKVASLTPLAFASKLRLPQVYTSERAKARETRRGEPDVHACSHPPAGEVGNPRRAADGARKNMKYRATRHLLTTRMPTHTQIKQVLDVDTALARLLLPIAHSPQRLRKTQRWACSPPQPSRLPR